MKSILAVLGVLSLAGCANRFSQYYHGMTKEQLISRAGPRSDASPKVVYSNDIATENERLAESNYALVGESSFQGRETSRADSNAIEQGKAVGADLIVLASRDAGTRTSVVPMVTPTTATATSNYNGSAFNPKFGTTNLSGSATTTSFGKSTTFVPVTVHRADYYAG
jgi:hypothetical protein